MVHLLTAMFAKQIIAIAIILTAIPTFQGRPATRRNRITAASGSATEDLPENFKRIDDKENWREGSGSSMQVHRENKMDVKREKRYVEIDCGAGGSTLKKLTKEDAAIVVITDQEEETPIEDPPIDMEEWERLEWEYQEEARMEMELREMETEMEIEMEERNREEEDEGAEAQIMQMWLMDGTMWFLGKLINPHGAGMVNTTSLLEK